MTYKSRLLVEDWHKRFGEPAYSGERNQRVDVAPVRRAFLASGMSAAGLALRLGWIHDKDNEKHRVLVGDGSRVERRLGLRESTSHGRYYLAEDISLNHALKIADALGVDPEDLGLVG